MLALDDTESQSASQTSTKPKKSAISWTIINFLLDALLLAIFVALAAVALILRFIFPPATQADGWTLWSRDYDQWSAGCFNLFGLFALCVLVHVMLHWSWICGVVGRQISKWRRRPVRIDDAAQTVYGVGLLILLLISLGVAVAAAALSIREPPL